MTAMTAMLEPNSPLTSPKTYPCPRCKKPTVWQDNPSKPFCSERCKLIDLGAWANEDYKIPAVETPLSDDIDNQHVSRKE